MRIVSLVPSVTETLFELGLGDQIVGITRYCILPKDKVRTKLKVGGTKNPDLHKIRELRPDIVIVNQEENRKEDADILRQHGVNLMITYPDSVQAAIAMVDELGEKFGVSQKSSELSAEMRTLMAAHPRPVSRTALILIWKNPYMTVNAHTYVDSICRLFGLQNVFAESRDLYRTITDDDIRTADPDVILFPDEPYPFRKRDLDEFCEAFPDLRAVREQKLLLFNGVYVTWHGYGTLRALRELPAVFAGL